MDSARMHSARMHLARLEGALGYAFRDRALLQRALTHRSAGASHNERLEFLGDAMLGYLVARRLFDAFPDAPEEDLTLMRAGLVRKHALAEVARDIALGDHLLLGSGERSSGVRDRASVLADALEAVVGAAALDGGIDAGAAIVDTLFGARIVAFDGPPPKDAKTRLQELLQARAKPLPTYRIVEVGGAAHRRLFTMGCRVEGIDGETVGTGSSRRRAEQDAAMRVMAILDEAGG